MTMEHNSLSREDLVEIYKENTEIVIDEVERLLPHLSGKTVISLDHGEMLGERSFPIPVKSFEHPPGIYTSELVDVPCFVHHNGERKEITEDKPEDSPISLSGDVEEHLEAMGYRM